MPDNGTKRYDISVYVNNASMEELMAVRTAMMNTTKVTTDVAINVAEVQPDHVDAMLEHAKQSLISVPRPSGLPDKICGEDDDA